MSRLNTIIDANIKENGNQEITGKALNYVLNEIAKEVEQGGNVKADGVYPDLIAGDLAGRGESVPAEFTFRASGGKSIKDGKAYIKRIKGNSVVWNNMADTRHLSNEWSYQNDYMRLIQGHKYLFSRTMANAGIYCIPVIDGQEKYEYSMQLGVYSIIFTSAYDTTPSTTVIYNEKESGSVQLIDLTKMFQAGNEPTTIEEFNARKPIVADEYAYNEGQVIHCNTESIKSVGDNAWDGVLATPMKTSNIRCLSNEQYCLCGPYYNEGFHSVFFYDSEDNEISRLEYSVTFFLYNKEWSIFTTPANCAYFAIEFNPNYPVSDYKDQIVISLYHTGWKSEVDNTFKPYWQDTLPLPIISKYFPQGMKKWDRIIKKDGKWYAVNATGEVEDMSLLYWDEGFGGFITTDLINILKTPTDYNSESVLCAAMPTNGEGKHIYVVYAGSDYQFNGAVVIHGYATREELLEDISGTMLYYELAEPIVTELEDNFRDYYNVADFGTEQMLAELPSAPFSADIIYQFNAVDMIRENYNEIEKIKAALAKAGITLD